MALQPCAWLDRVLKRSGCLCTLLEAPSSVESVAFSPDGDHLAVSFGDGSLQFWHVQDRALLRTLEGPGSAERVAYSYDLAFSPGGTVLALGLPDGSVQLWQLAETVQDPPIALKRTLGPEVGQVSTITSLAFSPDGDTLVAGAWDGSVQVWDIEDGALLRAFGNHEGGVVAVAFSPDGATLASASLDGITKLWNVATTSLIRELEGPSATTGLAFSPDGSVLAIDRDLWTVNGWTHLRELQSTRGGMGNVAFSPDGRLLAAGNAWYEVRWWRVVDGVLVRAVQAHTDSVNTVAFSPDGTTMASGSLDGTVQLWEVPDDRELTR
jgi:WD40 repeat protein